MANITSGRILLVMMESEFSPECKRIRSHLRFFICFGGVRD